MDDDQEFAWYKVLSAAIHRGDMRHLIDYEYATTVDYVLSTLCGVNPKLYRFQDQKVRRRLRPRAGFFTVQVREKDRWVDATASSVSERLRTIHDSIPEDLPSVDREFADRDLRAIADVAAAYAEFELVYLFSGVPRWAYSDTGEQLMPAGDAGEPLRYRVARVSQIGALISGVYDDTVKTGLAGYKIVYRALIDQERVLGITERMVAERIRGLGVHKHYQKTSARPLIKSYRPSVPLERFQMDVAFVKLPREMYSRSNLVNPPSAETNASSLNLLTVVDIFSKKVWAFFLRDTGYDGHEEPLRGIFVSGETPVVLQTDGASTYSKAEYVDLLARYGVRSQLNPSYRPQANGVVERMHHTLKSRIYNAFTTLVQAHLRANPGTRLEITTHELMVLIKKVQYSINHTLRHSVTRMTPFQVHQGLNKSQRREVVEWREMPSSPPTDDALENYLASVSGFRDARFDATREAIDANAARTEYRLGLLGDMDRFKDIRPNESVVQLAKLEYVPGKGYKPNQIKEFFGTAFAGYRDVIGVISEPFRSTPDVRVHGLITWTETSKRYRVLHTERVGNVIRVYVGREIGDYVTPVVRLYGDAGSVRESDWFPHHQVRILAAESEFKTPSPEVPT